MIESIEHLRPELHPDPWANLEVLHCTRVEVNSPQSRANGTRCITKSKLIGLGNRVLGSRRSHDFPFAAFALYSITVLSARNACT
ncbi:MAG: hypothetical protein ACKV2U_33035 [Bryobacteraceae bacterium]